MKLILILLSTIFVNNFVMVKFLGICPFLGVSKKTETAMGMGMAVAFVMVVASAVTYAVQYLLLERYDLGYLQTITFILVIAALVQLVEMVLQKISPSLYQALGVYLPLITTNCAVLGVAILNIDASYNLIRSYFQWIGSRYRVHISHCIICGYQRAFRAFSYPKESTRISDRIDFGWA